MPKMRWKRENVNLLNILLKASPRKFHFSVHV